MTFVAAIFVVSMSVLKDFPVLFKDLLLMCVMSEFLLIGVMVGGVKSHLYRRNMVKCFFVWHPRDFDHLAEV